MDIVFCCQIVSSWKAAGQTSDQGDQRILSVLVFFFVLVRRAIIISTPLSSFVQILWATCMTVTMTASGAQLLLLALCVYRGWGLQSPPRVHLSFKGEFSKWGKKSSGSGWSFVQLSHFHTPTAFFPLLSFPNVRKERTSCRMSNSKTLETKGGCYV